MNKTFSLLFHIMKHKTGDDKKAPIYLRVTVDKKRAEISLKRFIEPEKWNFDDGYARGNSDAAKSLNSYIDMVRGKVYEHHRAHIQDNKPVTALALKNAYLGISFDQKTLMQVFLYHNKQMKELVGREFASATYTRYETTLKHIVSFLKWKFKTTDVGLRELNHQFLTELDYYLRTERNCNNNSTVKYVRNFRKVVNIAIANDWISRDPFINYKGKIKEIEKPFLTKEEMNLLTSKAMDIPRLELVKDIFLFSCYTGLAYVDVSKLTPNNIVIGIDGDKWIKIRRTKTQVPSNIPLLEAALKIIGKYKTHREVVEEGGLLPILSNQKLNAYLKEIGTICGINKPLTFHTARHTFATTVTLGNGVSMESVSKMLGHKSMRTTQHYAKIVDRKLSEDMSNLKRKLGGKEP